MSAADSRWYLLMTSPVSGSALFSAQMNATPCAHDPRLLRVHAVALPGAPAGHVRLAAGHPHAGQLGVLHHRGDQQAAPRVRALARELLILGLGAGRDVEALLLLAAVPLVPLERLFALPQERGHVLPRQL